MYDIQKAYNSDIEKIIPLFKDLNPKINTERWRHLFTKYWDTEEQSIGHIIKFEDEIVGFAGLIFTSRIINGKNYKFCNRTSSVIRKDFQGKGLGKLLIQKSAELPEHTVTSFSSKEVTVHILKKMGFKTLDSQIVYILPLPSFILRDKISVKWDESFILKALKGDEKKYFLDHKDLNGHYFLLESKSTNETCLVILTKNIRKNITFGWIHYISNPKFFSESIHFICLRICVKLRLGALVIDRRQLLGNFPKKSICSNLKNPRLFKSVFFEPNQIDSLYSEFFLLM